jgi:transposase
MRYELSDHEWIAIKANAAQQPARRSACKRPSRAQWHLWVRRSGAPWRDLREDYGPYTTCCNRFVRFRKAEIWDRIMDALAAGHDARVPFAGGSSAQRHDHIRRNTTLRLFAGISVITGAENPTDCAIAATASRSRRPQVGLRSRRLRSNAWLLGAVANPSRLYGP